MSPPHESADLFFRWFPVVVAVCQLVFLPLILIALDSRIEKSVDKHNLNLYAHPSLSDLKKLEEKIERLSETIQQLQLAVERLTPRRRGDMVGVEGPDS